MIRVLIVDDHEMVRVGLRAILGTDADFEIVGECASAEALGDLVDRTGAEIVLLDARLPGVSGPEATRLLLASHPDARVIIVTSYSDEGLVDACIAAGAKGFVVKDIERFALKQAIRAVHRGEGYMAPSVTGKILERLRSTAPPSGERPQLGESQRQILRLVAEGFSNKEIAAEVHLSENTVKSHLQDIFHRLQVRNRVEAALRATREGLV